MFVVGGVRLDGVCWRCKDKGWMVFVVDVRTGGVCCWRCKIRWCLLLEV